MLQRSLVYSVLALAVCSAGLVLLHLNLFNPATSSIMILRENPMFSLKRPMKPVFPSFESTDLPAPLFNNTLFAWGGRITMVSPTQPVFELFILGDEHFRKKRNVIFKGELKNTLLRSEDFRHVNLQCHTYLNGKLSNLTWRENHNMDGTAASFLHRFHCPIDFLVVQQHPKIEIEIISPSYDSVYFEIPTLTHSIGLAGPNNTHTKYPLYLQPKVKYMLCNGGIRENGLHLVPEWLQHHTRMGFQHFMLGIDDDKDATLYNKTFALLEPLVEAGIVVLYTFHTPHKYLVGINKGDMSKNVFNEACLSYAKGKSEYLANWDLDEYWMPVNTETPSPDGESYLDRLMREYVPPSTCEDWCFISFPSTSIWHTPRKQQVVRQIAGEIFIRANVSSYTWRKSIARVKNTFNTGPHTFGSCLPNGQAGAQETNGKLDRCGEKVPHLGLMHHYQAIFRGTRDYYSQNDTWIQDEYAQFTRKHGYPVEMTRVIVDDKRPKKFTFDRVPPV